MFDSSLDIEQVFDQYDGMVRTSVRRRRLSLAVVWIGLVTSAVASAGRFAESGQVRVADRSYVVREGDTLWSIAQRISGTGDPRPMVDEIARTNAVDAGQLIPGQTLVIPSAA